MRSRAQLEAQLAGRAEASDCKERLCHAWCVNQQAAVSNEVALQVAPASDAAELLIRIALLEMISFGSLCCTCYSRE